MAFEGGFAELKYRLEIKTDGHTNSAPVSLSCYLLRSIIDPYSSTEMFFRNFRSPQSISGYAAQLPPPIDQ